MCTHIRLEKGVDERYRLRDLSYCPAFSRRRAICNSVLGAFYMLDLKVENLKIVTASYYLWDLRGFNPAEVVVISLD